MNEPQSKGTVLLIDNNENQNISNRGVLGRMKYTVHVATSYTEARSMIEEINPDIIVMEAALPDGDGFEFCQEIIAQFSPFIIFLTSKAERGDDLIGLRAGGNVYLTKPYHMPEFVALVEAGIKTRSRWRTGT
jgi:two-component system OmpR family response regulator